MQNADFRVQNPQMENGRWKIARGGCADFTDLKLLKGRKRRKGTEGTLSTQGADFRVQSGSGDGGDNGKWTMENGKDIGGAETEES